MAKPGLVLRVSAAYHRKNEVPEEKFYNFCRDFAIKSATIHKKHGTLKYQITCNPSSTKAMVEEMKNPKLSSTNDLQIEYYFNNIDTLRRILADIEFNALSLTAEDYIRRDISTFNLSWVEVYLDNGTTVNVDHKGRSLYPSFEELSDLVKKFVNGEQ